MSPARRPATRYVRPTLLLVGEGATEIAFLKHLKSLYCTDNAGVTVTIRNAYGKGPSHIIKKTVRLDPENEYDCRAALLDTDIPLRDQDKKLARRKKIALILSNPCIEGLLLSILSEPVPEFSQDCKLAIKKFLPSFKPLERESYASYFSKEILKEARIRVPELDKLLKHLEGIWSQK